LIIEQDRDERVCLPISQEDPDKLIPWPRVRSLTGLSRVTIWRWGKDGRFPKPVKLDGASARISWRAGDLAAWLQSRREVA
jgi:prophage regulatory protein